MNVRPVYAASLMIASLGALSVSAQNLTPLMVDYLVLPVDAYYDEPMTATDADEDIPLYVQPTDTAPAPLVSAPSDNVTPVIADETSKPPYSEPPINVVITPEDRDNAINTDVVNALSNDSRISGKIGVETYRQVVTLTGRVSNPMQADRAEQVARGVTDVNDVQNLIRARVGG
ncbi:MAG TPA: BON domain-containing protein [Usitatibacter sp.]|nr:BON domain-containing protein [Usitatibacter sp.]